MHASQILLVQRISNGKTDRSTNLIEALSSWSLKGPGFHQFVEAWAMMLKSSSRLCLLWVVLGYTSEACSLCN